MNRNSVFISIAVSLLAIVFSGCFVSKLDSDLLFYTSFDDQNAVEVPCVGPQSASTNRFALVKGKKGNALKIPAKQRTVLAYDFPENFFQPQGCIEFWAKIHGEGKDMRGWKLPQFFLCRGEVPVASIYLNWNNNNGGGGAGLCGKFQHYPATSDHFGGFNSCLEYLGGHENDWHHYALVWNFNGIKDISEEGQSPIKVAAFLDGKLTSKLTNVKDPNWKALGFIQQKMTLGFPDAPANDFSNRFDVYLDEFKIWKTDKTEFDL